MARWFNIGGPCNSADHYMLSATERLPDVVSLINKKQYFVVHAPRQCGKTTAFRALANEINAKGEMALGSERLDLGVHFRGAVYAVEVKKLEYFRKSPEKAYDQVVRYMDRLGVSEGWLVVADSDFTKPWDDKISTEDREHDGKTIHLVRC